MGGCASHAARPQPDLIQREVVAGGRPLDLLIPRDSEALLDEQAFEHEEFLPYWAELWPSGVALAEAVAGVGGRVLELGAGLGLPSLVAALGGAEVTATDWAPGAIELLRTNAGRNGAELRVERWAWTDAPPAGAPWPLVLAADVLYERRNVAQLAAALPRLVAPGGEAWIADPGRPALPDFLAAVATDFGVSSRGRIHRLRRAGA